MIHYFHLRLDEESILSVMTLCGLTEISDVSQKIQKILSVSYSIIESLHFLGEEQSEGQSRLINKDVEVPRYSLWIPLDKVLYRRLRQLRADRGFCSVARIIRIILWGYLKFSARDGEAQVEKSMAIYKKNWKVKREQYRQKPEYLSHMRDIMSPSTAEGGKYCAFYAETAIPLGIFPF